MNENGPSESEFMMFGWWRKVGHWSLLVEEGANYFTR